MTTIEAMKQADYVLASVLAVSPDSIAAARTALQSAIKREEAQTVEPVAEEGTQIVRTLKGGEREALIAKLRWASAVSGNETYTKAADILAADELSKCSKLAQQVAVPQEPSIESAEAMGAKGAAPSEAERLLFEAWMRGHCWFVVDTWNGREYCDRPAYREQKTLDPTAMQNRQLFAAWRDRAALSAPPPQGDSK